MSLKISNRATPKQIQILKDLDYLGKWDLSSDEAQAIITELWEEKRMQVQRDDETPHDWYKQEGDS